MAKETALAKIEDYAIATMGADEIGSLIQDNFGGSTISASDLDRVKCPSGGAMTWEIPSIDGPTPARALVGVIVYWRDNRAMWRQSQEESGGGAAPNCQGRLVKIDPAMPLQWTGYGDRDADGNMGPHDCFTCQYNEFGSSDKGSGKKCKETRLLAILQPDAVLPLILNVPATSLKALRQYFVRLAAARCAYHSVITRLTLKEMTNKAGIKYAEIVPEVGERLNPEMALVTKRYAATIDPILALVEAEAANGVLKPQETGSSFATEADTLEDIDTSGDGEPATETEYVTA